MKSLLITIQFCIITISSFCQAIDSAQFYYTKGLQENNDKLYALATGDFDKAIKFDSGFAKVYIANGRANIEMSRIYKASVNFTKAYQLEPKNNEVIEELSSLYFNNQQFQKAIDLLQQCSNYNNFDRILGISNYNLEDYAKAEKYLKLAFAENDKDADVAYTLGKTYLELENEREAIPFFQRAIALKPSNNQWMYELGLVYYTQNDFKSALKYFDLAADSGYNKSNDFFENYGFAQLYNGDTENGIKTLNIILERKPNNKELLNNIAHAMYDTKNYNKALEYFKKLLDINPKDAPSLYMAGLTLQRVGENEKGKKVCDNAIAMDPSLNSYRQKKEMPGGL